MPAEKASILSQRPARLGLLRQLALAAALLCLPAIGVLTAFGIAPDASPQEQPARLVQELVPLPEPVLTLTVYVLPEPSTALTAAPVQV